MVGNVCCSSSFLVEENVSDQQQHMSRTRGTSVGRLSEPPARSWGPEGREGGQQMPVCLPESTWALLRVTWDVRVWGWGGHEWGPFLHHRCPGPAPWTLGSPDWVLFLTSMSLGARCLPTGKLKAMPEYYPVHRFQGANLEQKWHHQMTNYLVT